MDTNHPDRLRSMRDAVTASPAIKICIDHHLEPAPFADHYVIDEDATSTGEIVYRILLELGGATIPAAVAEALYCAIMTDTGSFRYPRVGPETHRIAARLIECGADPVAIFSRVYERWSNGRMHLLGEMLANLTMAANGKIACVTITREMLTRTGTTEEDTDNFTTYPMSINGVQAGILFLELPHGVKISFRSRGEIPINELAREFGGNGHRNAAGARIDGIPLPKIQHDVMAAAEKYV
jgi:phosphoesterase RecJ-like protein